IFMGDVGSGLLGFVFAVFAIRSENQGVMPLLVWAVLLAPFIIDATATLVRRIMMREKWFEAHRSHAYQHAVQRGYSHLQVTSGVMLIDAGLVLLAYLAWRWPVLLLPVSLVVITSLLWLWQYFVRPSLKTIRS
ncbi:MAG: glycosyl transferase family 4, partial [Deinococcota bacterium]|nr:glycosyl transferase family 4 [Deinococcota bacterium]